MENKKIASQLCDSLLMTNRQINILIISLVLAGPLVALLSSLVDGLYFTFYVFPVTINSLTFSIDHENYRELSMVGLIVPLFFVKTLIVGVICLLRVFKMEDGNKLLLRFYVLVLVICVIKLVGLIINIPNHRLYFVIGLISLTSLIATLVWAIKNQRTARAKSHSSTIDI